MIDTPCCCNWGCAVKGEWPEFECWNCPHHGQQLGFSDERCKRHTKQAEEDAQWKV